jgi:hypothetical protein
MMPTDLVLTSAEWARFDGRLVRAGECLEWTGPVNNRGYGRFEVYRGDGRRRRVLAHRLAFFREHGRWPVAATRHTCDNPPCCDPVHLLDGTQADNIRDAVERGRLDTDGLAALRASRTAAVEARVAVGAKRCSRCHVVKAMDAFHRAANTADGHQYWCASCKADQQRIRRERAA